MKRYIQTREGAVEAGRIIAEHPIGDYGFGVEILEQTRTLKQNAAVYKYFELLGDALNGAGYEIEMKFLGKDISVPWNKDSVKERIWLPVMQTETGKTSTAKMNRKEVSAVYEVLTRFFGEKYEIFVPFPEQERG